jgi:soluble lytic murein transglycosylase
MQSSPGLPMARLASLLAIACLGSGGALLAGRSALALLPGPDPTSPSGQLQLLQRWAPDPAMRREASLLLAARTGDAPLLQHRLLRAQGWGPDPLAALALKRDAQSLTALGEPLAAEQLWRQLQRRFPAVSAAADGLYALGQRQPVMHQRLRQQFPAHPAALAAAQEAQDPDAAVHLARWGARWPGAEERLRERCRITERPLKPPLKTSDRDLLARGLAQLGDGAAALACLSGQPASAASQLAIARSLLRGTDNQEQQAETLLLQLAQRQPSSPEAREAVRLLSEGSSAASLAALDQLPPALKASAPVAARRALATRNPAAALAVLKRWPSDPSSWELQWQLAREALLQRQWQQAANLLGEPHSASHQPPLLSSRRLFWLGLSQWHLGQPEQARQHWQALLRLHPGGYYGWRASERLGRERLVLATDQQPTPDPDRDPNPNAPLPAAPWRPLSSGDAQLDRLWRLDQPLEAWEHWRHHRQGRPPQGTQELLLEGRLRRAVGDHWIGLSQLEQASLRLPPAQCRLAAELETDLHAPAFRSELNTAACRGQLPAALLAAVAKQESRFSPTVRSPVGAIGLLQLMPETAAELAGAPVSATALENPERNAELGARYLSHLLQRWQGNPLLTVASYNAGPGAVAGWINPQLQQDPELWVETIPYPETRLYVKKVLGNLWSFQQPRRPTCP